jgi:hypothetical protein
MVAYSFNKRFIAPIRVGLGLPVDEEIPPEPKVQTIRAIGKRRHARPDEVVQLYHGMRTKGCFLIGTAICKSVEPVTLSLSKDLVGVGEIGKGIRRCYSGVGSTGMLDAFARADGFGDWAEMKEFWREEHGDLKRLGPWTGLLIQWRPISRELAESADD